MPPDAAPHRAAPVGDGPHLRDEDVAALAHGDAGPGREAVAQWRRHVTTCPACRRRVDAATAADRRVAGLLAALDVRTPGAPPLESLARRARRPAQRRARVRWSVRTRLTLGTGAVALAGLAAAAMPAAWRASLLGFGVPDAAVATPRAPHAAPGMASRRSGPPDVPAGVSVTPGDRFEVAFAEPQTAGAVTLRFGDGAAATIQARGTGIRGYSVASSGVVVSNAGATASYDVRVPHTVRALRVRVAGRVAFARLHGVVAPTAPRSPDGAYTISLTPVRSSRP